jgi:hypothetical protein
MDIPTPISNQPEYFQVFISMFHLLFEKIKELRNGDNQLRDERLKNLEEKFTKYEERERKREIEILNERIKNLEETIEQL